MLFTTKLSAEVDVGDLTDGQLGDYLDSLGATGAADEKLGRFFDALVGEMGNALLYTAIALILGFALVGILLYKFRRDRLRDLAKIGIGTVLGVALIATALFFAAEFYEINYSGGTMSYFPAILALVLIALIGACLMGLASLFNKFLVKVAAVVTGLGMLGGFIALMVLLTKSYNEIYAADGYYSEYLEQNGLIIGVVVMLVLIIGIYALGKKRQVNDTKSVVYGAIAIAMSFALSYARLFRLPQGGSVTFASLLPLMIYCAMFGTRRGVTVCVIYGFLQALQDTWIVHPLQFLLDYPLAFGLISATGIFFERTPLKKNKIAAFVVGAIIAVLLRYACHVLSGVFAFGADAVEYGYAGKLLLYSVAYNSFTMVDLAIDLVAGIFLLLSPSFRRQMDISMQTRAVVENGEIYIDDAPEADEIEEIEEIREKSENAPAEDAVRDAE